MPRLKYLDVTRKIRDDSDDYLPVLGSPRARQAAQRDYEALHRDLDAEDNGRASPSYRQPMD